MPFLKYLNSLARGRYASPVTTPSGIVTIGELSDSLLLNIFRYYLDVSPQHWPRLVHICCRWRRIVFASQQILHLRIFYTRGMPALETLRYWPAMPIVVQYGGVLDLSPPALKDEDSIMAALKQSDRVNSISLTVTSSLLKKLSAIEGPFSELENLILLSRNGVWVHLPTNLRWGPRLRCLHLTRIVVFRFLPLLSSSTNLVDLRLHDASDCWTFTPEELTDALSGMAQLQSLSIHISSKTDYCPASESSWRRAVLPVLIRLDFRGIFRWLECLVAGINAPHLGDVKLTLLNENMIGFSNLREFIDRIEMHKLHRRAQILSSERAISISLIQPGVPACLELQLFCESSSKQLLLMTRICTHLSNSLSNVEDLRVNTLGPLGYGDSEWRDLLNSFTSVQRFHVAGNLPTNIVRALQVPGRWGEIVIPSLHTLYIAQPWPRHAPLREAVVTIMTSCRLSGHPIAVEYERLPRVDELRGSGRLSQQVTIEVLCDEIFLNIFRDYLDGTPRAWPTLTYVCQRWRHIVHTSPLGLNLRLYFTPGTPVLNALDCWPTLPIMVKYGGFPNLDPLAPEDNDNVIAALKQSDRVSSINLTVTASLLDKLSTISEPFSELEELVLLSQDNMRLTLPSTFRWGPRIRTLRSTRIGLPSLPQLLSPSHDLLNIQLHEIPSAGYFSPEVFANALSGMTQLETLSLHFLSLPPRRNYLILPPPPGERVVLSALTSLKYRGTSKYLDSLVARIDAPGLVDIDITFFSQPTMDASELGRFIERTGVQTSLSRAEVRWSGDATSISFTSSGTSASFRLQISCKQLDWQFSSMAQVCDQFSTFLFRVTSLRVDMTQCSSGHDVNGEQWLELIRAFGGATVFRVAGELTTAILCALGLVEEGNSTLLPNLRYLYIKDSMAINKPSYDGILSFITSRSRSGHPIQANVPFEQCQICHSSFRKKKGLDRHLTDEHGYRILCSYCKDFECKPGHNDLFRKHLTGEHPEAWRKDARIWSPSLTARQLDSLVTRYSYLHAPDTVAPSTTATALHPQ